MKKGGPMARIIGMDVHRTFAEVAIHEHGRVRQAGRILTTAPALELFARGLTRRDHVVLEATCNTHAIARLLRAHAGRVVVSNPRQTRVIAEAKIKTDKIDAAVLIQLHASGFLPEVWMPDEGTEALRRQVSRRAQIVRHRTRLKNQIHAILHRNLVPRCPASDLFGLKGRAWLATQPLPPDERAAVTSLLRALDHGEEDLTELDRGLAGAVLDDAAARRLMTIPGVDFAVAVGIIAAIGDVSRFRSAQKLVSYFGLNPRVRQSGLHPAQHGRITKQGRAHARGMLVEAAWAAAKTPGPLRAFFARVCARRGRQIAAVATARKLAVLVWHLLTKQQDYAWARPSLTEQKRRKLELRAGQTAYRGQRGRAHAYNLKILRTRERAIGEQAERAYQTLVAHWRPQPRKRGTGAANAARR
jgi:transposase